MPKVTGTIRAYLGVDPGTQGGMTLIYSERSILFCGFKDKTKHEIAEWIASIPARSQLVTATLEAVHAMPKQGVSAMFSFGKSVGFVEGLLIANGISYIEVSPQRWQKHFGIPPRKDKTITEHKKVIQSKAHQLFPAYVKEITREVADSVLLAEYLRQTEKK